MRQIVIARTLLPILALLAALSVGGCALVTAPVPSPSTSATTRSRLPAITDNEVVTPPGPDEHAPNSASPQAALTRFALGYINWDGADVRAHLETLARDSVGQARSEMTLEATQTGADRELTQAGIANHGSVEAIAQLHATPDRYVVVTKETTTATDSSAYEGLQAAWHLTVATVAHRHGGWVISGWQPEN